MTRKKSKTQEPEPNRRFFPILESITQAAAAIGAPLALLKAAKRKGCKAFVSGNRIDCAELLPFLFKMLAEGNELPPGMPSAVEWLTIEKAKREAIKRKVDEKMMMPTADAQRQNGEAWGFVFDALERGERELPPALAGATTVEAFKILHNFTEGVRVEAKQKFLDQPE